MARKVPELCKPYTPGRTDQDIHARIARLEHIIEVALPQFANQGFPSARHSDVRGSHRAGSYSDDEHGSQAEEQDLVAGTFESGKWYGNNVSGSIAASLVIEEVCRNTVHCASH